MPTSQEGAEAPGVGVAMGQAVAGAGGHGWLRLMWGGTMCHLPRPTMSRWSFD
jgi:hypothetical protein